MEGEGTIAIVVGHNRWVWVGIVERLERETVIRRAKCLRRWGTKSGLGELVDGPLEGTILDRAGTIRLHPLQVLFTVDVEGEAWEPHLEPVRKPKAKKEKAGAVASA